MGNELMVVMVDVHVVQTEGEERIINGTATCCFPVVTTVHIRGFSSGLFPLCVPLSFIWNSIFCWVPFGDHGMNERRVRAVREAMNFNVNIEMKGRVC